jgi:nitronate monooxygenase
MDRHDHHAVTAYPEIHYLTAPTRAAARERGDADWVNLWAGQAYPLAQAIPAADVVRNLAGDSPIDK